MHYFKLKVIFLLYSLAVSFQSDCTVKSVNFIPFIVRMVAGSEDCWGVVVSSTSLLVNQRCISSHPSPIYLITHNAPPLDIITVSNYTSNTDLKKFLPAHSKNDWALFGLPSPLKFTQFLKAVHFPLESSINTNYSLVMFKSGRLALSPVQLQDDIDCKMGYMYGEDFDSNFHYCVLESNSPNDDVLTSVKDSVAHLMLNEENTVVGLVLPTAVTTRVGKMYRVLKIAPVLNWIKSLKLSYETNSNKETFLCNTLTENTAKQLMENFARETIQDMSKEFFWLLVMNDTELQRNVHEAKMLINRELDARFRQAHDYVDKRERDILSRMSMTVEIFKISFASVFEKISKLEEALKEKDSKIALLNATENLASVVERGFYGSKSSSRSHT